MTRTRSFPARIGRRWVLASGRTLPVISGGDPSADPENPDGAGDAVEVPEDLTDRDAIADEALVGFEDALVAEFDRLVEEGSRDVARLTELAAEIDRVRAEQERRNEVDAETDKAIQDLVSKVKASDEPEADPEDGNEGDDDTTPADDDTPADDKVETPEPVPAANKDAVTAAAPAPRKRISVPPASQMRSRAPQVPEPAKPEPELVTITAAADVPGFTTGGAMGRDQLPLAMHKRAVALKDGDRRVSVATINRAGLEFVNEGQSADEVLDRVVNAMIEQAEQHANGAAALVAAGGWCRPAETFMDLFAIEGADALFDLPTIGVNGSGLMVPSFIGFNAADNALWSWSIGNDTTILSSISNLALTSNVVTVDTSANHNLAVGNKVRIENLSDTSWTFLNGQEVTVATVVDANTFTFAFTHANVTTEAITEGTIRVFKPSMRVPCPTWTEYDLTADGLSITHGNLTNRAWPALGQRYVDLAVTAHERRMARLKLAQVIATISGTDTITLTDVNSDGAGELLAGVDLATLAYRDQYGMSMDTTLEAIFPLWVPNAIRATLARRAGVDLLNIPLSQIVGWFVERNVRPQFVRDFQPLYTSGGGPLVFPATVQFLIYPAGGYFAGSGGSIDLGVQRDSKLNEANDFTLAWMEEFYLVGQRGPDGRLVTVATGWDGVTACCP